MRSKPIKWTKEDEKIIEEMFVNGKTNEEIFNYFTEKDNLKNMNQMEKKISRMGLPKKYDRTRIRAMQHIGEEYGRLKIIDYVGTNHRDELMYKCVCSCENKTEVVCLLTDLRRWKDNCGCLTKEKTLASRGQGNTYDMDTYDYGICFTYNGEEIYFDKEDYDKISGYIWHSQDGYANTYVMTKEGKRKRLGMHRLLLNAKDGDVVDHINRKPNDNRKLNLRICTIGQNNINHSLRKDNKSGVVGVRFDKRINKWVAQIRINGKSIHLGSFYDKEDAIAMRRSAEEKYFGDFFDHDSINNGKDR